MAAVPFLDIPASFDGVRDGVLADIAECLETGAFTNGPAVAEFESAFAEYCGVANCVGVASGLDALRLALQALEIGPGDEVLVPAMTFIATWEAVSQVGATPIPVDISGDDYCMDLAAAEASVGEKTRAIIPVHLYGQMVDPRGLTNLASRYGLAVVEDACQAHGARRGGALAGSVGDVGAFSFYPTKNLGAIGDAGALVMRDESVASRVRALREHGQAQKNTHTGIGWTARLDTIQASALLRKLPHLDGWNDARRTASAWYAEVLDGLGDLALPPVADNSTPVWHVYVVRTADPLGLAEHLRKRGIATSRHYPEAPHLSEAYAALGHRDGACPIAEGLARECLSLPMFPGITEEQIGATAAAISEFFQQPR